jgi:hypothetical protein
VHPHSNQRLLIRAGMRHNGGRKSNRIPARPRADIRGNMR